MTIPRCVWVGSCCWSLVAMTVVAAQDHGIAAGRGQGATAFVRIHDGRLTIRAQNESLGELLRLVARRTNVAITVAPGLEAASCSLAIVDVPLEEGLRRLVGAYDAFLFYAGAPKEPRLAGLWVFPRGQGRASAPLDTVMWASDADVARRLADPDSNVRLRALEALIERRGQEAIEVVLAALADADESVRAQVLDLAFSSGLQIPPDRWSALALSDPSPLIRLQVLQLAPDGPELTSVAETAQHDLDPHVQLEARSILARHASVSAPSRHRP